jgi:EAL domain-containing protein (putative c-di-GMP-specific phosphodiesterase class I)
MAAADEILLLNFLVEDKTPRASSAGQIVPRALRAVRSHLGMDLACVTERGARGHALRYADAGDAQAMLRLDEAAADYFSRGVVEGRLPTLAADARRLEDPVALAHAQRLGIGSYLWVPIRYFDGTTYGTLACMGCAPDASLGARDASLVRVFAEMASEHIEAERKARQEVEDARARVRGMIESRALTLAYQAIYELRPARVVGFEALARFTASPVRAPDAWFSDAARAGLEIDLEMNVIDEALAGFASLPAGVFVSFNVSPNIILNGELEQAFRRMPADRIVLEINDHLTISEYGAIAGMLRPLRERGLRIAVDNTGEGLASFHHIVCLKPDIIKLHRSLTREVENDAARRALAAAVIRFARDNDCDVIAEGVESPSQLKILLALGVARAQGYFLGRPSTLESAAALCRPRATEPLFEEMSGDGESGQPLTA